MWLKWLPWKYIVRRTARSHGFLDPISLLSHIRRFSQPSEVNEPIELLRAGVVLHARGLINSRVIQHNLDWVWPYWVNRQFNPKYENFIPRAFSLTNINLSARNWTAIGVPECSFYPVVDPCGLVMPFWDSWSIDAWVITDEGELLAPPRQNENVRQKLLLENGISIETSVKNEDIRLLNETRVSSINEDCFCLMNLSALSKSPGWLVVSLRPCNPEGISFIHTVEFSKESNRWSINEKHAVFLSESPDKHIMSDYKNGDVSLKLLSSTEERTKISCDVGMATAGAIYRLEPDSERTIKAAIPLSKAKKNYPTLCFEKEESTKLWQDELEVISRLSLSYKNFQFLYDASVRSVLLHSPKDIYPGPFTYKRFWFRDAVFIVYAMLCMGLAKKAEKLIDNFFDRQSPLGYFHSQQGEWDSNGQVLWVINKYCQLTGNKAKDDWLFPILKGAKWIIRKRTSKRSQKPHAGLLPAGFSAEHFGPNDYYYWDDFWAVAGLQAASLLVKDTKYDSKSVIFLAEAEDMFGSIERSLSFCRQRLRRSAMPISPYRRLDSAAVGSLAACYPLGIFKSEDERVVDTAQYLLDNCIVNNGLFHDIGHSGINPYLTLHLAQVLMRINNTEFHQLTEGVAELASSTGQWPEAINPRTGSGCMGDGQHVWASAEWILMMVNSFVMVDNGKIVLGAGFNPKWLEQENEVSMGPVMTEFGSVSVKIYTYNDDVIVGWDGNWRAEKPIIEIKVPGYKIVEAGSEVTSVNLTRDRKI